MRRLAAALALLAVCACTRSGVVQVIPPEELDPTIYGNVDAQPTTSVDVYFVEGNRLGRVTRTGPESTSPEYEIAMIQLLRGPNAEEMNRRQLTTAIPDTTELLGVSVSDGIASVDLSGGFYRPADESPSSIQAVLRRLAQVVWTLTEIQGISRVRFMENGQAEAVLDQRRFATETPLARSSYRQFAPRGDRSLNTEQLSEL